MLTFIDFEHVIKFDQNNNIALSFINEIKGFLENKSDKKYFDNKMITKLLDDKYKY